MTSQHDQLLDHEYDGIREYDNPLPGWWVWLFILSFIFSIGYFYWYSGLGDTVEEKHAQASLRHLEKQLVMLGEIRPDDETIVRLMQDTDMMSAVGGMFRDNCAQCHAADGGGNVGPNLTDENYKNIKRPVDIFNAIANGIPNTNMAGWSQRLREPQMILLASYVATLRGTTPAKPKDPEGMAIPPWPTLEELTGEAVGPATDDDPAPVPVPVPGDTEG